MTMLRTTVSTFAAAAALATLGCSPQPPAARAAISDKVYTLAPGSMTVKAGIVAGEVSEMKITERVEEGSGRIDTPARFTAKLVLKNVSPDQSVRLLGGKIVYLDSQGRAIPLEAARSEPTIKAASSYGSAERLDPGQEATQTLEGDFPAEALQAKRLKDIRVEISYIPSAYKQGAFNFPVSISGR
jgi:hypothetical protein